MDAASCLDNIIQSEGNSPEDWNTIVNILRQDQQE